MEEHFLCQETYAKIVIICVFGKACDVVMPVANLEDFNAIDSAGWNPVHVAVRYNKMGALEKLGTLNASGGAQSVCFPEERLTCLVNAAKGTIAGSCKLVWLFNLSCKVLQKADGLVSPFVSVLGSGLLHSALRKVSTLRTSPAEHQPIWLVNMLLVQICNDVSRLDRTIRDLCFWSLSSMLGPMDMGRLGVFSCYRIQILRSC